MDKNSYATVTELLLRNVSPVVCLALAPYQRDGVEFILDNDGRALLADEMGLGKTALLEDSVLELWIAMSNGMMDWDIGWYDGLRNRMV